VSNYDQKKRFDSVKDSLVVNSYEICRVLEGCSLLKEDGEFTSEDGKVNYSQDDEARGI